ncbi:hypothetical protein F3651_16845 [Escherichia coli]|nr:hypothetical protein [Escherichia coli]EFD7646795.1 hypothetical protein [Escherichia coli]MGI36872.1 hypothetical protein [Escherichia coli]
MACVNSRVATALVGCTAPVLKSHTHIKNRGAENSLYFSRGTVPFDFVKSFFEIFSKFFHLFFVQSLTNQSNDSMNKNFSYWGLTTFGFPGWLIICTLPLAIVAIIACVLVALSCGAKTGS